jgi:hypothetical protein
MGLRRTSVSRGDQQNDQLRLTALLTACIVWALRDDVPEELGWLA